jgi:hypothetical protein
MLHELEVIMDKASNKAKATAAGYVGAFGSSRPETGRLFEAMRASGSPKG